MIRAGLLVLFVGGLACGGDEGGDDGPVDAGSDAATLDGGSSDGGSSDGGFSDSGPDAGDLCLGAAEGESCPVEGASCGECSDPCSFCNLLRCEGGTWTALEVFPAPCFDCGELRCRQDTQYCEVLLPGRPEGMASYTCREAPVGCEPTPSCACVEVPGGSCDESGDGVIVTLAAP